jgi:hypothetical protein
MSFRMLVLMSLRYLVSRAMSAPDEAGKKLLVHLDDAIEEEEGEK